MASVKKSPDRISLSARIPEMNSAINELQDRPDREIAIIGGSLLESLLIDVLSTRMVGVSDDLKDRVFDGAVAPLNTFSGRIVMAQALGLITGRVATELNKIRDVRNAFAHGFGSLTFAGGDSKDGKKVIAACKALTILNRSDLQNVPGDPSTSASVWMQDMDLNYEVYETLDLSTGALLTDVGDRFVATIPNVDEGGDPDNRLRFTRSIYLVWFILLASALGAPQEQS